MGLLLFVVVSCKQRNTDPFIDAAPLYAPMYAQGFTIKEQGDLRILYIKKSWQGNDPSSFTYLLYPRKDSLLYGGKEGCIPYPIKNAVCLSTTHIAYLATLNQEDCISGVSGAPYISHPKIREAISQKSIIDVGFEAALNYETLFSLQPDVIFAYGIAGESTAFLEPLARLGLQVVYVGDYLEAHPLGKAEYMIAFSAFFETHVMEQASIQFQSICHQYNALKERIQHDRPLAKVLINAPFKDSWYIPGGENYMAQLLGDAGALILGSKKGVKESHVISLEQAYLFALEADYWLHPNAFRSLETLGGSDARFTRIPAFKAQRVYNNTRRYTPQGGSDFWESGVTEPHIILADLIHILHPEWLPEHPLIYYEQLPYSAFTQN